MYTTKGKLDIDASMAVWQKRSAGDALGPSPCTFQSMYQHQIWKGLITLMLPQSCPSRSYSLPPSQPPHSMRPLTAPGMAPAGDIAMAGAVVGGAAENVSYMSCVGGMSRPSSAISSSMKSSHLLCDVCMVPYMMCGRTPYACHRNQPRLGTVQGVERRAEKRLYREHWLALPCCRATSTNQCRITS